jgi:hypothetical protein
MFDSSAANGKAPPTWQFLKLYLETRGVIWEDEEVEVKVEEEASDKA